jgi:hypothetical protein
MIKISTIKVKDIWGNDERVERIRETIKPKLKKCKEWFDTQDLEHQVLFRLTTFYSWENKVDEVFEEQKNIILERMRKARVKPQDLFCFGKQRTDEWQMLWGKDKDKLYCINGENKKREIFFNEITLEQDKDVARSIINDYHYIHCSRCDREKGMMFGFFLKGHKLPFAIEEIEPCDIARNYKKAILMMADVNYHTTSELTRFYSVPNTPKNLISLLDKMVGRELKYRGYEWMITATMPAFCKTKSSTISGGIDIPLFAKELKFDFFQRDDDKYELCVNRKKEKIDKPTIKSVWKLSPVIEMIKPLKSELKPSLKDNYYYYVKKN